MIYMMMMICIRMYTSQTLGCVNLGQVHQGDYANQKCPNNRPPSVCNCLQYTCNSCNRQTVYNYYNRCNRRTV